MLRRAAFPRRLLPLAGAVCVVAIVFGPVAARSDDSGPPSSYDSFQVSALARGLTVHGSISGFLPTGVDAADVSTAFTESHLESTRATALGAFPYPSDALLGVPGLVAGFAQLPNLPTYPLAARASDPTTPDASASDVGGGGAGAMRITAHADPTRVTAVATLAGTSDQTGLLSQVQIPGLPAVSGGLFSIGSLQTTTVDQRPDAVTFRSTATSTLSDVGLVGGALHIGQLTTIAHVELRDGKATYTTDPVMVSGATLMGTPVGIDEHGVSVGPSASSLSPVADAMNQAMAASGLVVRITPAARKASGPTASVDSGSLVLEGTSDFQGYPLKYSLQLGGSTASINAVGAPADAAVSDAGGSGSTDVAPGVEGTSLGSAGDALTGSVAGAPLGATKGGRPTAAAGSSTPDLSPAAFVRLDFRPVYPWLVALGVAVLLLLRWLKRVDAGAPRADIRDLWRW